MTKAARPDPRAFLTSTLSTLSASALLVAGLAAAPARATTPLSLPANPRVSADIGHPGQAKTATTPDRRLSAQPRAGIGHVAAKSKPKPKIMPATKMITVTWGKVAGATKYQVAYALKKSMKGKKRVTTKRTQAKLKKLKNGKKYYVTVTAQIGAKKVTSKKLSATPTPNWPGSIVKSFKLSSHGLNQVTAKWRKPRAAASILVRVAATRDAFRGKKLPAT
ncbi:MAG: hypothetical protein LBM66_02660, partial [Bifidobacteriaceae bacterium]|nr:hypothetical protein [Bifidobacteriaceae bacterium]